MNLSTTMPPLLWRLALLQLALGETLPAAVGSARYNPDERFPPFSVPLTNGSTYARAGGPGGAPLVIAALDASNP